MPLQIAAQATCDQCRTTAPCWVNVLLSWKSVEKAGRSYEAAGVAIHGLPTWFWRDDALACSEACKATLSEQPRFKEYQGRWKSCH